MIQNPSVFQTRLYRLALPLALAVATASGCRAQQPPPDWSVDCVGRLSLNLPGPVEVGAMTSNQFIGNSDASVYSFADGQRAGYSRFLYGGLLAITHPLSAQEIKETALQFKSSMARVGAQIASGETDSVDGTKLRLHGLTLPAPATGWQTVSANHFSMTAYLPVGNVAIKWRISAATERSPAYRKDLEAFLFGVRPRPILTVPAENGVCLPNVFVQDSGRANVTRIVATTYRLREHPDVTIMVEDATATAVPDGRDPKLYSAVYKSNFFWTQRYRTAVKSLKSLLNRKHNKIKLARQDAVETMFQLERENGTEDFGYLVISRGDPDAAVDTPDIMLYVIRDADNAKKKGFTPVPKDEFFAMAKSIAASVQRREIKKL